MTLNDKPTETENPMRVQRSLKSAAEAVGFGVLAGLGGYIGGHFGASVLELTFPVTFCSAPGMQRTAPADALQISFPAPKQP